MSTPIFTYEPEIDGLDAMDNMPNSILSYAGTGVEQRATLQDIDRRTYTWPMRRQSTDKTAIKEFFRLRSQIVEAFYIMDPEEDEHARTGVSLGTSTAAQVTFTLPTAGENSRDYPADDANAIVYDDGTPIAVASVDTDARTITVSVAPAAGSTMTCDYHAYRLVRLVAPFAWSRLGPDYFGASPQFVEVVE